MRLNAVFVDFAMVLTSKAYSDRFWLGPRLSHQHRHQSLANAGDFLLVSD